MSKPVILLDLRKYRIRIHRQTLHLLGNPKHVVLLVNQETRSIAVCCCSKSDPLAHHIDLNTLDGKQSCEIYSMSFVKTLLGLRPELSSTGSYRIDGVLTSDNCVAKFSLDDIVQLTQQGD